MGCFSWLFADTNKALRMGHAGHLYAPTGEVYSVKEYDGYGVFAGLDVYDLVANWNREYLSQHPDFLVPQHGSFIQADGTLKKAQAVRVDSFFWYKYYQDLSLSPKEVEKRSYADPANTMEGGKQALFEYRFIGIALACYDDQNAWLPYPIKIAASDKKSYETLRPSLADPNQGMSGGVSSKETNPMEDRYLRKTPSHVCPCCGGTRFAATAHVTQDWEIDGDGNYTALITDHVETTHAPDDDDIWECITCGYNSAGKDFTGVDPTKATKPVALRFYKDYVPFVRTLIGNPSNAVVGVERQIQADSRNALAEILRFLLKNGELWRYIGRTYYFCDASNSLVLSGTLPDPRCFVKSIEDKEMDFNQWLECVIGSDFSDN